jgi:hypothetical protein
MSYSIQCNKNMISATKKKKAYLIIPNAKEYHSENQLPSSSL